MPKRIETDTPEGDALGFTGDLFSGWLEMYEDSRLYLYYIISRCKNEGNTRRLLMRWLSEGYDVRVVMPSVIMRHIISKFNFMPYQEYLPSYYEDPVDVWRRPFTLNYHEYISRPATRIGSS